MTQLAGVLLLLFTAVQHADNVLATAKQESRVDGAAAAAVVSTPDGGTQLPQPYSGVNIRTSPLDGNPAAACATERFWTGAGGSRISSRVCSNASNTTHNDSASKAGITDSNNSKTIIDNQTSDSEGATQEPAETDAEKEVIVLFKQYHDTKQHPVLIKDILGLVASIPKASWSVVDRNNAAVAFPSDFALVRIHSDAHRVTAFSALRSAPTVRSVVKQRLLRHRLLQVPDGDDAENHHGSAHDNSSDEDEDDADDEEAVAEKEEEEVEGQVSFNTRGRKRRLLSRWSFDDNLTNGSSGRSAGSDSDGDGTTIRRNLLRAKDPNFQVSHSATAAMGADKLWAKGYSGKGIKVAIFDTGLRESHPHHRNVVERVNWTEEDELDDRVGHGSFVAGVVASHYEGCKGFAPDADLHIFKVFTSEQMSYTSWFLDAFNYAIHSKVHIVNLSIGGPDFHDEPFVDKVNELTSNGIIMISAIGNDGPLYGTLNNPGDQPNVIGVGGITFSDEVAPFSSRGMTTWELPEGYGRFKPDVVAYGARVLGSGINNGCKALSGTSVAAPVVTGASVLLASTVRPELRRAHLNPASLKQALIETAVRVNEQQDKSKPACPSWKVCPDKPRKKAKASIFEQGHGKIDLVAAMEALKAYQPRASFQPATFDTTDCPFMWPYCAQPIFAGAKPIIANVTVLNGMGVIGWVEEPPRWSPNTQRNGDMIEVSTTYSKRLWPWSGWLGVRVGVSSHPVARSFDGVAEGTITMTVFSHPQPGSTKIQSTVVSLPLIIRVIKPPARQKRILWDQFHSLAYPAGYFPRDDLQLYGCTDAIAFVNLCHSSERILYGAVLREDTLWRGAPSPIYGRNMAPHQTDDPLDWNGDHPHTNFKKTFTFLRELGYFVDVLDGPFNCFDAHEYGTLLIIDPEEEYFDAEISKLKIDVESKGLGLIVLADWYSVNMMDHVAFQDDNTRNWWYPETGGANIPALNELLSPWQIEFGEGVFDGRYKFQSEQIQFNSGAPIARFPASGTIMAADLADLDAKVNPRVKTKKSPSIMGFYSIDEAKKHRQHRQQQQLGGRGENAPNDPKDPAYRNNMHPVEADGREGGRIVVYGDSSCLDEWGAKNRKPCLNLLKMFIEYASLGVEDKIVFQQGLHLDADFPAALHSDWRPATRSPKSTLHLYSKVLSVLPGQKKLPLPQCPGVTWMSPIASSHEGQGNALLNQRQQWRDNWAGGGGGRFAGGKKNSQMPDVDAAASASAGRDGSKVALTGHEGGGSDDGGGDREDGNAGVFVDGGGGDGGGGGGRGGELLQDNIGGVEELGAFHGDSSYSNPNVYVETNISPPSSTNTALSVLLFVFGFAILTMLFIIIRNPHKVVKVVKAGRRRRGSSQQTL